jgi:hypothetical protein
MARTIKRMHGPAQVSNAAATKYTAPATGAAQIRHIHVSNPSGSAATFTLSIGADAAALRVFDAYSVAANSVLDHFGIYNLAAAEIVQAFSGTNNVLVLTIDGDELPVG